MVKKLSKLFALFFALLLTFTISGCTNNQGDGQEYSIIYINGSTVVDLEPRTYISGEVTELPSLGEDFVGWYTNKELSGDPVNEIKANSTGNLIFYTNYNLENDVFYLVVFKDYDNKVLKEESVKENESATAPSAPTREGYEFIGWSGDFSNVKSDLTIVALYKETVVESKKSISSQSNTYTFIKGTSLEDVLHDVNIVLNYSDGTSVLLDNKECIFTCEYNMNVVGIYEVNVKYGELTCKFNIELIEDKPEEKTIEEYVNVMTNFKYIFSYDDPLEGTYSSINYFENDIYKFEVIDDGTTYYDYVYYDNEGSPVYLYDYGDGTYETLLESDSYFEDYYYSVDIIDLSILSNSDFTFNDNCFTSKSSVVDDVTFSLIGGYEGETYTSLKIYVSDSYIAKIVADAKYQYNSQNYTCTYQIVFSNVGTTSVTLPSGGGNIDPVEKDCVGIQASATNINVLRGTTFEEVLEKINISLVYNDSSSEILDKELCTFIHQYSPSTLASYEVKVVYGDFEFTFKINVVEEVDVYEEIDDTVTILEDILDEMGEYDGTVYGITKGLSDNSKVLVIPVEFSDYKADNQMQSVLEKVFFGTSEETGWESLKSYYYKSSYGKCNISGTVLPVFSTGNTSKYYDSMDDDTAVNSIIKAALEYYDNSINYDEYDSNGDNYIDSIYIIYTAPIDYESDDSLYWAFSYQYFTDDYEYYDSVEADFYCFMGYDFIFETLANGKKVSYNAETIIHESGHLFGLDDYYDYDDTKGPDGGIGGGDMMDYNVGDHNPFSKMILGWVTPKVIDATNISSDITIDLKSFGQSGECLVIVNGWENSYFDEYFVIDFYTPDGLNALEAGYSGLFSISGIRIYHVDSRLNSPTDVSSVWEVYKYNNTDTNHKLIKLIQADGMNEIENKNEYSDNGDLFQVNDKFTNIKWYDNSNCKFEIIVNSISAENAQITIKYIG